VDDTTSEMVPPGVDVSRPSVARVYDYYLGGSANWAIDREFGDRVLQKFPLLRDVAIANRMWLMLCMIRGMNITFACPHSWHASVGGLPPRTSPQPLS